MASGTAASKCRQMVGTPSAWATRRDEGELRSQTIKHVLIEELIKRLEEWGRSGCSSFAARYANAISAINRSVGFRGQGMHKSGIIVESCATLVSLDDGMSDSDVWARCHHQRLRTNGIELTNADPGKDGVTAPEIIPTMGKGKLAVRSADRLRYAAHSLIELQAYLQAIGTISLNP